MTDDKALVAELRHGNWIMEDPSNGLGYPNDSPLEAADRIEALTAEVERLRAALLRAANNLKAAASLYDCPGAHEAEHLARAALGGTQ